MDETNDAEEFFPLSAPSIAPEPQRTTGNGRGRVLRWAIAGFGCAVCFACGVGINDSAEPRSMPQPNEVRITVTVTKTREVASPICVEVLGKIQRYLKDAARIASVSGHQLDILDAAYVAILNKDWKKLNQLNEEQRRLQAETAASAGSLLPDLDQINREIQQCQSSASRPG